ncbi:hypothetical protein KIN20_026482 [Parelaphostrongylus tenuis]|uniref:Uncharacterized protein n=1 Tax=Parelaphostrongylus tenuis TaxID=148309 RepID=A0AAD5QY36_PARTN|nr:hypothetical protein KIN20_026482 [Parelaphostrongylus tenuis]
MIEADIDLHRFNHSRPTGLMLVHTSSPPHIRTEGHNTKRGKLVKGLVVMDVESKSDVCLIE